MKINKIELNDQNGRFLVEISTNESDLAISGNLNLAKMNLEELELQVVKCLTETAAAFENKTVRIFRPTPSIPMPNDGKFYTWDESQKVWIENK